MTDSISHLKFTIVRSAFLACCAVALVVSTQCADADADKPDTPETSLVISNSDRILILAPHPDDEVLGCGGIIQKAIALKRPVRIVFLTYGDSNEMSFLFYRKHPVIFPHNVKAMGRIRHEEAIKACRALGLSTNDVVFLGYPDFGMMRLWGEHWGKGTPPLRSTLTRVTKVCYPSAYRPGAPFKAEEVLKDITSIIRDFKPTKVFVSHPGDENADHRALYLFTRVALWDLEREMKPILIPYLIHYNDWPFPKEYEQYIVVIIYSPFRPPPTPPKEGSKEKIAGKKSPLGEI